MKVEYPYIQKTPFGSVKVYRAQDGERVRFYVTWVTEEGRQRKVYREETEALQRAKEIVEDFSKGVSLRSKISASKAALIADYERRLAEVGASLGEAVNFYLERRNSEQVDKTAASRASEVYLNSFEDKRSRHYQSVKSIIGAFSRVFGDQNIDEITVNDLDRYFRNISTQGRTRNNHLSCLKTFFRWAQGWNRYLPKGEMPIDKIEKYPESQARPELFTPEEIKNLLNRAPIPLIPYLAIGAFAGVRCAEIERLTWDKVDLEHKVITLESDVTKTKRRRLAVMPDNLVEWLRAFHVEQSVEHVIPFGTALSERRAELCRELGMKWKKNGLRKSYISYRMAQPDADAAKVAKQCGNSPDMVEQHYKGLVMPKTAEEWFSIVPSRSVG